MEWQHHRGLPVISAMHTQFKALDHLDGWLWASRARRCPGVQYIKRIDVLMICLMVYREIQLLTLLLPSILVNLSDEGRMLGEAGAFMGVHACTVPEELRKMQQHHMHIIMHTQ